MKTSIPCFAVKRFVPLIAVLVISICSLAATVQAATNKKPILISQSASTRAVAVETITLKAEPFSLTQAIPLAPTREHVSLSSQ